MQRIVMDTTQKHLILPCNKAEAPTDFAMHVKFAPRMSVGVIHADPNTCDWDDFIKATEYCIPSYGLDTFKPTRYAMFTSSREFDWYPWN